jgi:hypothetical protein
MNERIRQLVLQAKIGTADFDVGSYYVATPDRMQEFAELIIRECIDCVRGAGLTDEVAVKNNLGFNDGLSAAVVNVQKHFGVEE